ncbi:MAG: phenylacetate-CoA oxygenase/reductase subunit PaaK [Betaproteobacteria bacterium]|nr:phenylacetate-CoA oxygenase/reductase subunit PaaK [Betaproteobacteria bacterium]
MSGFYSLQVASVQNETRDAVAVSFTVPKFLREQFLFEPGQYLTLRRELGGEELRRNYSICSVPEEDTMTVAIKRVAQGKFSVWANDHLHAGERLDVMTPAGRFVRVKTVPGGNYLAIAAGSGVTPILSIIKTTLREEPTSRFTLVYGNRAAHSVMFREALEDMKNSYLTRFSLVHILSREHQDVDIFNGRIDLPKCRALLSRWIGVNDVDAVYLCGPQSMMDDASTALAEAGVDAGRIHRELFFVESAPVSRRIAKPEGPHNGECTVTVIQDGRSREFRMARGTQTVLRAALAQGIELPWSCQGGICSTCRCKVVEGEVDMDSNFSLEDYEIARGFRLACQSYAVSERLTIDYDQHA